jgi:hypothetical protein
MESSILNGAERLSETAMQSDRVQIIIKRLEQHIGAQTNIEGNVKGSVLSGKFDSAVAVGDGEALDRREKKSRIEADGV